MFALVLVLDFGIAVAVCGMRFTGRRVGGDGWEEEEEEWLGDKSLMCIYIGICLVICTEIH